MRIVTEIVQQEVTKFFADDGTEFSKPGDCIAYEKNQARAVLKAKLNKIERCEAADGFSPLDGAEYMEEHDYTWYRPKNREEATVLRDLFDLEREIDECYIGHWICVEETWGSVWCYPFDWSIDHVKEFFEKFGYKVTITKEDENV